MGPNLTRPASYRRIKAPCERDLEFWSGVAMFGRLFFSLCISFIDTQHLGEWFRTNLSHSFSLARSKIPNKGVPVSKMGSSDLSCGSPNIKCFFLSSTPKNPLFGSSKLFFVWYQVNQSVGSYMGWTPSIAMRWWLDKQCPGRKTMVSKEFAFKGRRISLGHTVGTFCANYWPEKMDADQSAGRLLNHENDTASMQTLSILNQTFFSFPLPRERNGRKSLLRVIKFDQMRKLEGEPAEISYGSLPRIIYAGRIPQRK